MSLGPNITTHLKVMQLRPEPPLILDHQVPVLLESLDDYYADGWDLTSQQVFPDNLVIIISQTRITK